VQPGYGRPYVPPTIDDFALDYECPSCHGSVAGQDPNSIKTLKTGIFYRVCPLCSHSHRLHYPPTFEPTEEQRSSCGCGCKAYRPGHGTSELRSITCECGHLGSYHTVSRVVVGGSWRDPLTRKNALKSTSTYDTSFHGEVDN